MTAGPSATSRRRWWGRVHASRGSSGWTPNARGTRLEAATAVVDRLSADGVGIFEATIAAGHEASEGVARHLGMEATDEVEDGERVWRRAP